MSINVSIGQDYRQALVEQRQFCDFGALGDFIAAQQPHGGQTGPYLCAPMLNRHRRADQAQPTSVLALDFDSLPAEAPRLLCEAITAAGWRCALWTTRRHSPAAPRLRIVLELDRAVGKGEYSKIYRAVVRHLGEATGLDLEADPSCAKPEQAAVLPQPASTLWTQPEGVALNVDAFVAFDPGEDRPTTPEPTAESPGNRHAAGQRNDSLFRLACRLRKSGLEVGEIHAALLEANFNRCTPPLDAEEVLRIAESACRYQTGQEPVSNETPDSDAPLFLAAHDICDTAYDVVPPIIDNILLVGATLVHGPAKKGKSWLLLQMALAIDSGSNFLGCHSHRHDVLFVGAEDTAARFKSRLERMHARRSVKFMTRDALVTFATRLRSLMDDAPMTPQIAVSYLWDEAGRPSVIFIDTQEVFEVILGIAHGKPGDSITRRDYQATSSYDAIANKLGIAIVLVGHWGEIKNIAKATVNPHECLNTTKARLAGVTTSITLGPLPNQEPGEATREMQLSIRSRDLPGGDQFLWLAQDEFTCVYECRGTVRDMLVTEAQTRLFTVLMDARKEHGPDLWLAAADLADHLDCSPQAVKQMVGRVRRAAKAKGRKAMYQGLELESKPNMGYRLR